MKLLCFFNYHKWHITDWIMPYKKQCERCKKKMTFIGYNIWMEE